MVVWRARKAKKESRNRLKKEIDLIMFLSENVDVIMMFVEWCGSLIDNVYGGEQNEFCRGWQGRAMFVCRRCQVSTELIQGLTL